jgi:hypothetical protein
MKEKNQQQRPIVLIRLKRQRSALPTARPSKSRIPYHKHCPFKHERRDSSCLSKLCLFFSQQFSLSASGGAICVVAREINAMHIHTAIASHLGIGIGNLRKIELSRDITIVWQRKIETGRLLVRPVDF